MACIINLSSGPWIGLRIIPISEQEYERALPENYHVFQAFNHGSIEQFEIVFELYIARDVFRLGGDRISLPAPLKPVEFYKIAGIQQKFAPFVWSMLMGIVSGGCWYDRFYSFNLERHKHEHTESELDKTGVDV